MRQIPDVRVQNDKEEKEQANKVLHSALLLSSEVQFQAYFLSLISSSLMLKNN